MASDFSITLTLSPLVSESPTISHSSSKKSVPEDQESCCEAPDSDSEYEETKKVKCSGCHYLEDFMSRFFDIDMPCGYRPSLCYGRYFDFNERKVTGGGGNSGHCTRSKSRSAEQNALIENLIDKDRQLEAIKYIYEFGLADKFSAEFLLRDHLVYSMYEGMRFCSKKDHSTNGQMDALKKQIAGFKDVLKCIRRYEIECDFPMYLVTIAEAIAGLEVMKKYRARKLHGQEPF